MAVDVQRKQGNKPTVHFILMATKQYPADIFLSISLLYNRIRWQTIFLEETEVIEMRSLALLKLFA